MSLHRKFSQYLFVFNGAVVGHNQYIHIVYVIIDLTKWEVKQDIIAKSKHILILYKNEYFQTFLKGKTWSKNYDIQEKNININSSNKKEIIYYSFTCLFTVPPVRISYLKNTIRHSLKRIFYSRFVLMRIN